MRRVLTAATLITVAMLGTGCTAKSDSPGVSDAASSAPSEAATAAQKPLDPKVEEACVNTMKLIDQSTTKMTEQVDKVVAAIDTGDSAAQAAQMGQIHATFKEWSAAMRTQAESTTEPKLRSVLTQYAGAVDAKIASIKTPEDLDKLHSFDDSELDQAASNLAEICN